MFRKKFLLISVCCFLGMLFLAGCTYRTSTGTEITESDIAWVKDSVTTKDEILLKFGEPTTIVTVDSNKVALFLVRWINL